MKRLKIGIRLESLGLSLRRALTVASQLGVGGVQVDAIGDLSPRTLSQTGRREFRNMLRSHNLELTALGCPLRHGLDVAEDQQPRLEHIQQVLSLAYDMGPRVVVVQAGPIPAADDPVAAPLMTESLLALGHHGDRVGANLALETGLESGETLAAYLDSLDTGSIGVNLDPANLLMHGFSPIASIKPLKGRILHTHAKDARKVSASRAAQEVPLGHGDIEWMEYLETLREVEYYGWLTIERETGDNRVGDIEQGVTFLRRFV